MVYDTRELNRNAVLTALMEARPASRKRLAELSGISQATVTRAVEQLIAEGIVAETSEIISESRGRRAVELDIVADLRNVVGVDLGASRTRVILADLIGNPLATRETLTPVGLPPQKLAQWLADQVRDVSNGGVERLDHVCIGLPGAVSARSRIVTNAPNLPQIMEPGFLERVEEAVGRPTGFDNDANYALLGELHFGAAKGSPNAAMLTIGYGLGAGLAIDGRILRGEHGLIGEFGQLPIGPFGSRLESMVTGGGILRRAVEAGIGLEDPSELFAETLEPPLQRIRVQFDEALNVVLAALTVSGDPQVIVIGGGIAASLTTSLSRYAEALERNLGVSPRLVNADLGRYSGAAGAVVAALHRVYGDLGVHEASILALPQHTTPFKLSEHSK